MAPATCPRRRSTWPESVLHSACVNAYGARPRFSHPLDDGLCLRFPALTDAVHHPVRVYRDRAVG